MNTFKHYINNKTIRKVNPDLQRAKNLQKESERKINNLKIKLKKLGIQNENANDYVEYCYDIIMIMIRSKLHEKGLIASGYGAHEAEVAFLRKLGFSEKDVQFCDQLRYFRNGILYYGKSFDKDYAQKVIKFLKEIKKKLN